VSSRSWSSHYHGCGHSHCIVTVMVITLSHHCGHSHRVVLLWLWVIVLLWSLQSLHHHGCIARGGIAKAVVAPEGRQQWHKKGGRSWSLRHHGRGYSHRIVAVIVVASRCCGCCIVVVVALLWLLHCCGCYIVVVVALL
jgi:hypothetical protein